MPNISFASGGDAETLDYVAYVAKDKNNVRSCYVLECGGGLAQEVITTIGQAFELRYGQLSYMAILNTTHLCFSFLTDSSNSWKGPP